MLAFSRLRSLPRDTGVYPVAGAAATRTLPLLPRSQVRIHPAIPPGPADDMTRAAQRAVASGLPPERLGREILGI